MTQPTDLLAFKQNRPCECGEGCDHWSNSITRYQVNEHAGFYGIEDDEAKKRAALIAHRHPHLVERWGNFEDWSYEDERYILEEMRGGHWADDERFVSCWHAAHMALTMVRLESLGTKPGDASWIRRDLLALLDGLVWDATREADMAAGSDEDEDARDWDLLAKQIAQAKALIAENAE